MRIRRLSLLFALLAAGWQTALGAGSSLITGRGPLPQPEMQRPAAGAPFTDSVFGTRITRITDARAGGIPGICPDYAKRQAWNADETLVLLRTGEGDALLYDGSTYEYLGLLDGVCGEDVFWHPTDPGLVLFNPDNTLYVHDIGSGSNTALVAFDEYTFANTRGEGNLSRDGHYYAFAGQLYDEVEQVVTFKDLIVYDLGDERVIGRLALPTTLNDFDWVSISPLGDYVVADYADEETGRFHGVEVYTRDFEPVWQKPLGLGHSDLGLDASGDEVLVMAVYDPDANLTLVNQYRLRDGKKTELLALSPYFDLHISCQNEQQQGWCFISTFDYTGRLTDDEHSWLAFEDEIFALRMDGSGEVRRITHHYSRRFSPSTPDSDSSVYFAEPHATVSRAGDRVIFGSNWRYQVERESSVDAYVAEFEL